MTAQMTLPGLVPQWTLGDRLRKAREIAGLNQSEMSEQIGIARNSVANYEGGRYDPPRPVLIAWAFRTGVALSWLTKGDDGLPRVDSNHQPAGIRPDTLPVTRDELLAFRKTIRHRSRIEAL